MQITCESKRGRFDAIPVFLDDQGKMMDYGAGVKLLRQKLGGITARALAGLCGVSERTVNGWEQGRKQPSGAARTLLAIARTNPKAVLAVSEK